ncbi:MAG: GH23, partial [uncultured Cytophagales bacterium]
DRAHRLRHLHPAGHGVQLPVRARRPLPGVQPRQAAQAGALCGRNRAPRKQNRGGLLQPGAAPQYPPQRQLDSRDRKGPALVAQDGPHPAAVQDSRRLQVPVRGGKHAAQRGVHEGRRRLLANDPADGPGVRPGGERGGGRTLPPHQGHGGRLQVFPRGVPLVRRLDERGRFLQCRHVRPRPGLPQTGRRILLRPQAQQADDHLRVPGAGRASTARTPRRVRLQGEPPRPAVRTPQNGEGAGDRPGPGSVCGRTRRFVRDAAAAQPLAAAKHPHHQGRRQDLRAAHSPQERTTGIPPAGRTPHAPTRVECLRRLAGNRHEAI